MVEKMFPLYSQLRMGIARILLVLVLISVLLIQILILLMMQVLIDTLIDITLCYLVQKVDMMAIKESLDIFSFSTFSVKSAQY